MSKIFDISGNYKNRGKWETPETAFSGEIIVDNDGSVFGYCNDYEGKVWYILGNYAEKEDERGHLEFYMLSNDPQLVPCLYVFPNLPDGEGTWWRCIISCRGDCFFKPKGEAKIVIGEERNSYQEEQRIKSRFNEVELRILMNSMVSVGILENHAQSAP